MARKARQPKPGTHAVFMEMREALYWDMVALAEGNGRSFKDEMEHAAERHLAKPPRVEVVEHVPELDDPPLLPPVTPKRKPGRPRKPKPKES